MLPTKSELIDLLKNKSSVQIQFTKKSTGENRVMLATLNRDVLAQAGATGSGAPKPERQVPEHLVHVYDVEASGWRSFDIATLTSVKCDL